MSFLDPRREVGVSYNEAELAWTELLLRLEEPYQKKEVTISSTARDANNTTTTILRAGLVLGELTSTGECLEWGKQFADLTAQATTPSTGDTSNKIFVLAQDNIVPGSETIKVDGVAQDPEKYSINYRSGVIVFGAAPASVNVTADFTHIGTEDGTEIVEGVLLRQINLKDEDGTAVDTSAPVLVGGWLNTSNLVFDNTNATQYGHEQLATRLNFKGVEWTLPHGSL